jgi:hypothetical protein
MLFAPVYVDLCYEMMFIFSFRPVMSASISMFCRGIFLREWVLATS